MAKTGKRTNSTRKGTGKGKRTVSKPKTASKPRTASKPKHTLKWYRDEHVKIPGAVYKVDEKDSQRIKVGKGKYKTVKKRTKGPLGMYPSDPEAKKKWLAAHSKPSKYEQERIDKAMERAIYRSRKAQDEYEEYMAGRDAVYYDDREVYAELDDRGHRDRDKYWKQRNKTHQVQALKKQAYSDFKTYGNY